MNDAQRFLSQNDGYAETLTDDDRATVEQYAEHHSGGLYVLGRALESGLYVKSHESWGGPDDVLGREHVVHMYDPDADDDGTEVVLQYFDTGHEALQAFLSATDATETVRVLISYEITGPHTAHDLDVLLGQAYAQFDDPRDEDGERVAFSVRMIGSEWETE